MPTYNIRASSLLKSYVEYEVSLWGTDSLITTTILTETVLDYSSLSGTLLLGLTLTEATSTETGEILWFTATQIGLGKVSDAWTGGLAVTGTGVSMTGGTVVNSLERTADTPLAQILALLTDYYATITPSTDTIHIDVKNTEKIILTNIGETGLIRLCHETSSYLLSPWLPPGKAIEFYCKHQYRKLLVLCSEAAGVPFSLGLFGRQSTQAVKEDMLPRGLSAPSQQMELTKPMPGISKLIKRILEPEPDLKPIAETPKIVLKPIIEAPKTVKRRTRGTRRKSKKDD